MASNYLYKREFVKSQREKGLCIECSNTSIGLRCKRCTERRAKRKKENYYTWKEMGMCCVCGRETLKDNNLCERDYLKAISHKSLGTSRYWKELKLLLEQQQYKCGLTGDIISLNNKIELDHIVPITRGGTNDLSNVRWVTKEANRLKQNLTDDELKILCKKILLTI